MNSDGSFTHIRIDWPDGHEILVPKKDAILLGDWLIETLEKGSPNDAVTEDDISSGDESMDDNSVGGKTHDAALRRIRELERQLADMTADYHRWHDAYLQLKYPGTGRRVASNPPLCKVCDGTGFTIYASE
jgi:hypothetical protein